MVLTGQKNQMRVINSKLNQCSIAQNQDMFLLVEASFIFIYLYSFKEQQRNQHHSQNCVTSKIILRYMSVTLFHFF